MSAGHYEPEPDRYDGRMFYRRCGRWGLRLPAVTLGCWRNFGGEGPTENQRRMLYTAFDCGITHFDLANNYGPPYGSAERNVGTILRELPRDELLVSTKAGFDMWEGPYGEWGSRKCLLASLDQSLRRLGLDYVDLFYSHRFDPETPLEETLGALNSAVQQGKALYAGISSYDSVQTREAVDLCRERGWAPVIIHQPNYSMLNRWVEKRLLEVLEDTGTGCIAFCPLYQGLLTDRYLEGVPSDSRAATTRGLLRQEEMRPDVLDMLRRLQSHAWARGQSLAQMALSWLLRDPRVTSVLIGASRPAQIRENARAVHGPPFTAEELGVLDGILAEVRMPSSLWASE
ncbi:MAG TPA: aldo/keto reductase [Verrucomicrobiales bacterium]|nr:aldo/keto reductase [Verrucomicrobiales bacterium]